MWKRFESLKREKMMESIMRIRIADDEVGRIRARERISRTKFG